MKKILPLFIIVGLAFPLWADEQTRQIQSALSEAGFYFGTVDGKMGEDTRGALRRFQIRNGLDVSGEASAETLSALKVRKSESAAAEDERQMADTARTPTAVMPGSGNRVPETEFPDVPNATRDQSFSRSPLRDFFAGTDLEDASTAEQSDTLLRAQTRLAALGYYRTLPDGLPGQETESALLRFQYAFSLRRTARLDADTRRALADAPPSVASKPFRSSRNRPPGVVYRGVWVR